MQETQSGSGYIPDPQSFNVSGKPLFFDGIKSQLGFLKGEILTIVEAAFSEGEQRKAVKDLVRDKFTARERHFAELCEDGSRPTDCGRLDVQEILRRVARLSPEDRKRAERALVEAYSPPDSQPTEAAEPETR